MPNRVSYSPKASADVRRLTLYQLQYHNEDEVEAILVELHKEIDAIANTPRIGVLVGDLKTNIRHYNISKNKYKMYYRVVGQNAIKVLRVWPTRRRPLTLVDIES